jgi:Disulphide bond corrector protein DsbC
VIGAVTIGRPETQLKQSKVVIAAASYLVLAALAATSAEGTVAVGKLMPITAEPGTKTEISVAIDIPPGFHVQANPASRPELIPLSIRVTESASLTIGTPLYPAGRLRRVDASPELISLYEGSIRLGIPVEVPMDAGPGERIVRGLVRFQACDDKRCHLPATVAFAAPVLVSAPPNCARVPAHRSRRDGSTTAIKSSKCDGRKDGR